RMAKFVSVFISAAHRRLIAGFIWTLCFLGVIALLGAYALHRTADAMQVEAHAATAQFARLRQNLTSTFMQMRHELTAEPCSPGFNDQMRRIAYLPDGLNEFLYVTGGTTYCSVSVSKFDRPVALGEPDMVREG